MRVWTLTICSILVVLCNSQTQAVAMDKQTAKRMDSRVHIITAECDRQKVGYMYPVGICIKETHCRTNAVCYAFWLEPHKVKKNGKEITVWKSKVKEAYVGAFQLSLSKVPDAALRKRIRDISHKCRYAKAFGTKAEFLMYLGQWQQIDPRFDFEWSARVAIKYYASMVHKYGREDLAAMGYHGGPGTINGAVQAEARSCGQTVPNRGQGVAEYIKHKDASYYSFLATRKGGYEYWCKKRENHLSYANSSRQHYLAYTEHRKLVGLSPLVVAKKPVSKQQMAVKVVNSKPEVTAVSITKETGGNTEMSSITNALHAILSGGLHLMKPATLEGAGQQFVVHFKPFWVATGTLVAGLILYALMGWITWKVVRFVFSPVWRAAAARYKVINLIDRAAACAYRGFLKVRQAWDGICYVKPRLARQPRSEAVVGLAESGSKA